MKTFDELQRLWHDSPVPPVGRGVIRCIGVRKGNDVHETPLAVEVTRAEGVVGDRWTPGDDPERHSQITLMNSTAAELIAHGDTPPQTSGDNFYVDLDIGEQALPVGTRLRLGTAVLEVSPEPHMGCSKFSARFGKDALRWARFKSNRRLRLRGIHCLVIEDGFAKTGDEVVVLDDRG